MTIYSEPALLTGWEAHAPADDTILRAVILNWWDAIAQSAISLGGRVLRRDDLLATDLGRPSGYNNVCLLGQPLGATPLDEVMTDLDDFFAFAGGGRSGEVGLFSPWPTPDLRPFGWKLAGHPPLHLLPPGQAEPPLPPGLTIEPASDAAALAEWEAATIRGFPMPELDPTQAGTLAGAHLLSDPRFHFWIGRQDGQTVAIAATCVAHGLNHVLYVATLPEARRRGFGAALTWRAALTDPALPAVLLSSDDGRRVYDRMGFYALLRFTFWYRPR